MRGDVIVRKVNDYSSISATIDSRRLRKSLSSTVDRCLFQLAMLIASSACSAVDCILFFIFGYFLFISCLTIFNIT
jgi:hypothetical protein